MNSQARRTNDFSGTDLEYIAYLESLVRQVAVYQPPSPPHSVSEETSGSGLFAVIPYEPHTDAQDCSTQSSDKERPQLHEYGSTRAGKRKRAAKRWQREMDGIIDEMIADNWSSRRTTVGFSSQAKTFQALDMLIHGKPQMDLADSEAELSMVCDQPSTAILPLLNAFAITTSTLRTQKTFTKQIFFFREFIFVSLCCVALFNDVDQKVVDKIMQLCVSDSSEKHLAHLRKGALWVNQIMVELAKDGLNYLAYELFVLWGKSVAQYSRFADAGDAGFYYFKSRVPQCKPKLEIQASLPFWIPFIIKTIVGDVYSLQAICSALGYGEDPQILEYPRYLSNYRNRRMPFLQSTAATQSGPLLVPDQASSNSSLEHSNPGDMLSRTSSPGIREGTFAHEQNLWASNASTSLNNLPTSLSSDGENERELFNLSILNSSMPMGIFAHEQDLWAGPLPNLVQPAAGIFAQEQDWDLIYWGGPEGIFSRERDFLSFATYPE